MNSDTEGRRESGARMGAGDSLESAAEPTGPAEKGQAKALAPIGSMPAHELRAIFEPSEMF